MLHDSEKERLYFAEYRLRGCAESIKIALELFPDLNNLKSYDVEPKNRFERNVKIFLTSDEYQIKPAKVLEQKYSKRFASQCNDKKFHAEKDDDDERRLGDDDDERCLGKDDDDAKKRLFIVPTTYKTLYKKMLRGIHLRQLPPIPACNMCKELGECQRKLDEIHSLEHIAQEAKESNPELVWDSDTLVYYYGQYKNRSGLQDSSRGPGTETRKACATQKLADFAKDCHQRVPGGRKERQNYSFLGLWRLL